MTDSNVLSPPTHDSSNPNAVRPNESLPKLLAYLPVEEPEYVLEDMPSRSCTPDLA